MAESVLIEDDVGRLRDYIDKVAKSGDLRLPPEPKLGDELGVSRGRLRTILKRLEGEGLIWRHVGKGTFVGPREMTPDDQHWSGLISVDNVLEARLLLEPQLAAQAALHATPADLAAIDACLAEMERPPTFLHWKRLDERLHRIVAEATHNPLLMLLYEALRTQVRHNLDARIEQVFGSESGPKRTTHEEHADFVEAIRAHDPIRAEKAMRLHLNSVRDHLFGLR